MKILITAILCASFACTYAQTTFTRSYPIQQGQQVKLKFDYPVVKASTWDKNEVSVVAHVTINDGDHDSAFILEDHMANGTMMIAGRIKDMDKLPHRYTIVRLGKKTVFRSKEQYLEEKKKGNIEQSSEGLDIDIVVELKVPLHSVAEIKSIYGMVELTNFNSAVNVEATYGGIDATLATASTGKLQATTHYGQIYTNLDIKITDHTERDFYHSITAEPGTGPAYNLTSTYGKIYLRKP